MRGRATRLVSSLMLVAVGMAAGALIDRSSIPRPYGGSFPAIVGDSRSILALTVGESPPGIPALIREKTTGRIRVLPVAGGDLVQAGNHRRGSTSLDTSTAQAAEAAAALLPERAALVLVSEEEEPQQVELMDGRPVDLGRWRREQAALLQQVVEGGPEAVRGWSTTITLADGRDVKITASGTLIRVENTTGTTWRRVAEREGERIVDGVLHLIRTEPELRSSGRLGAEALIPPNMDGTSAGLAYALAHLDHALGGDLSGGRRIAATGVIAADGQVSPVLGVEAKSEAARAAGAGLLLVGAGSSGTAVMPAVPVWNLDDAVVAVCRGARTERPETGQLCHQAEARRTARMREQLR